MKIKRLFHHFIHSPGYIKNAGLLKIISYYKYTYQSIKKTNTQETSHKEKAELFNIPYRKYNLNVMLRKNTGDLLVYGNVCLANSYEFAINKFLKTPEAIHCIVDAGANIGITSSIFASLFPSCPIFSIEPDGGNYEMLKKNTQTYSNVRCLNLGLWNKQSKLKIERGSEEFGFRLTETSEEGDIDVISLQDLMECNKIERISILKIDVEGSEFQIFDESSELWIEKTDYILIEIHDAIIKGAHERVMNRLSAHGFQLEKSPRKEESVYLFTNPNINIKAGNE